MKDDKIIIIPKPIASKTSKPIKEVGSHDLEGIKNLHKQAKQLSETIGKRKKAVFIPAKVAVRQSLLREFPNQKYL